MPKVSEFFGIAIYLYHDDHPPPHFHAHYQGRRVRVALDDLTVLSGDIGPRALSLVLEWARLHRAELASSWERARAGEALPRIAPLE